MLFFLGPHIVVGEFMIDNVTYGVSVQDLLGMYVYHLMEPVGNITDALTVTSEYTKFLDIKKHLQNSHTQ